MFKHGEYIKGSICVLGALLFGIPIFIGWFSKSNSIKEDKPSVPRLLLPATKEELIKLAKHITGEDKEIMKVVLRSLENPKAFCQMEIKTVPEQLYDYQDLLFDWYEEEDNDTNLRSIVMLLCDWQRQLHCRIRLERRLGDIPMENARYKMPATV